MTDDKLIAEVVPKLEPCPFCGGDDLELDCFGVTDDDKPTDWRVTHIDGVPCQAWGPEMPTREAAIAAWNRRASGWCDDMSKAPRDGRSILGARSGAAATVMWWDGWDWIGPAGLLREPTHWQPLPAPPTRSPAP